MSSNQQPKNKQQKKNQQKKQKDGKPLLRVNVSNNEKQQQPPKKVSTNEKQQQPPKKVFIKKILSPKGISPKGINQPIDTNRSFPSFVPNFNFNTTEENYKDFIQIYNDYSQKQTEQTQKEFESVQKTWKEMTDKQKNKLFKKMVNDVFVTFQRDHRNIEDISHEFTERELNLATSASKQWLKNIYDNKLIHKDPKTFKEDSYKVCCDLDNITFDALNKNDLIMCYKQLPDHLTKIFHKKKNILYKKFGIDPTKYLDPVEQEKLMKITLSVYKDIVKQYKLCSKYKLLKKIEKNNLYDLVTPNDLVTPKKYLENHRNKFKEIYNQDKGIKVRFQSNRGMPKDLNSILKDTIDQKIDKKYIPIFDDKKTDDERNKQIDQWFESFINNIEDKNKSKTFIEQLQNIFNHNVNEITVDYLEKLKEKIKNAYSKNSKVLSNSIETEYGIRINDDIFFRNSTNLCIPHDMNIHTGTVTLPMIKEILNKEVLYTAIEDGSNKSHMKNIKNIFIAPSKNTMKTYITDYRYVSDNISNAVLGSGILTTADPIHIPSNMYLHVYTFRDFLIHPDYQIYFIIWWYLDSQISNNIIYDAQDIKNKSVSFNWDDKLKKTKCYKLKYVPKFEWDKLDTHQLLKIVKESLYQTLLNDQVFIKMYNKKNYTTYINDTLFPNGKLPESPKITINKILTSIFEISKKYTNMLNINPSFTDDSLEGSEEFSNKFGYFKNRYKFKDNNDYRYQWILKPQWITYKFSRWGFMTQIYNGNYKNKYLLEQPKALEESEKFINITKQNKGIITFNKRYEFLLSPQSNIYYMLKQCLAKGSKYNNGIIARMDVRIDKRDNDHDWYFQELPVMGDNVAYVTKLDLEKDILNKQDYQESNHANYLIINTKDTQAIEVYIFDMNYTQSEYIRGFIHRALEKCKTEYNKNHKEKIGFMKHSDPDNKEYFVKVITGKTLNLPDKLNFHGKAFDYVKGGICSAIATYTIILWTRYHNIFGSFPELIKYIYNIIDKGKEIRNVNMNKAINNRKNNRKLSRMISELTKLQKKRTEVKKVISNSTLSSYKSGISFESKKTKKLNEYSELNTKIKKIKKDILVLSPKGKKKFKQRDVIELWQNFENAILTYIIFSADLYNNDIIQNYLKTKKDEAMKKWAEDFNEKIQKIKAGGSIKRKKKLSRTVGGGKRTRKTKKVRKHRGIIQTGGNKGKLKKGYKYTGKRLKNGLSEIKKVKAKK